MEALIFLFAVLLASAALMIWAERVERRDRRQRHAAYHQRGGLAGSLMRNWRRLPKLTDQRDRFRED